MIFLKRQDQIAKIAEAGKISKSILLSVLSEIKAGTTGLEIDKMIGDLLGKYESKSWFREVNHYKFDSCVSVNENWIHGIPNDIPLKEGDIVSVDLGVKKDGYYTDNCWTIPVMASKTTYNEFPKAFNSGSVKVDKFLETGVKAVYNAINVISKNTRVGAISHQMEKTVEKEGYSVITEYAGHGIGISTHEDPLIPCYGEPSQGPMLKNGMVIAIEIMYAMGEPEIETAADGWTVRTKDRSLTGMFEHTVAIVENKPLILTN